jgi:hypothetical protein
LLIGLGVLAGAVVPARVRAQVPVRRDTIPGRRDTMPTRTDTLRRPPPKPPTDAPDTIKVPVPPRADSTVKNDSIRMGIVPLPKPVPRDTIKSPLARAEAPPVFEIGPPRIYDRTALFATGALTLSDLLARVPGLTEMATGYAGAPVEMASLGDTRRIRIFLDGVQIDPLNTRAQGAAPVNDVPIAALEEVRIERGAEEVRVYARSWRVDRTTAYTRADVATGDLNTNLYRAFFGRRYDHGEALQLVAEQLTTQPDNQLPSSSALHLMARVGLTRGPWSADAFAQRSDVDRGPWVGHGNFFENRDTVRALLTRKTTAYLRLSNGDPDVGRWFQMIASSHGWRGTPTTPAGDTIPIPDTSAYENQYVATGGITRGGLRLSGTERLRAANHTTSNALSGRAAVDLRMVGLSLLAEQKSAIDPSRLEASAKVVPFDRLAVVGAVSRTGGGRFMRVIGDVQPTPVLLADGTLQSSSVAASGPTYTDTRIGSYELAPRTNLRAEAGVRVADVWVSGGVIRRGPTTLFAPAEFDTSYARPAAARVEGEATARTAALRGRLYKALYVDAWALAWTDSTGLYRPKYQTRSELYIQTNLLDRFPRGNFGLLASLVHEYHSGVRFASADTIRTTEGYRLLSFKLEIRIQTAVVSYQFRNVLQERYQQVPGFFFPRQAQLYGVRWDFWN